jgi:hypothetical protein
VLNRAISVKIICECKHLKSPESILFLIIVDAWMSKADLLKEYQPIGLLIMG